MWVLFGTNHHTVENEPHVFFIGVFHSLELANRNKEYLLQLLRRPYSTDFFVKEVTMDHLYTYEWSNGRAMCNYYQTTENVNQSS